ncbi:hypothetical protein [Streptomyces sp. KR80]|uniref:hypothetical protein n=1 Tax=Streptomyces sp. KR80 TaxID=3457426 RepID=UPI003FD55021
MSTPVPGGVRALPLAPLFDFRALPTTALDSGVFATGAPPAPRKKPPGAASDDELSAFSPPEVADWYRRLALMIQRKRPDSLAAQMLLHWLDGKGARLTFSSAKVEKLRQVTDELKNNVRPVFLTEKKARVKGGEKWGGVIPRIQKLPGVDPWDGSSPIKMSFTGQSVEVPLAVQAKAFLGLADEDELDLLMSLHTFGLKTEVVVTLTPKPGTPQYKVDFTDWQTRAFDRYDWDPSKHIKVPNPDYGNPARLAAPVAPDKDKITVYHSNAKRVEAAGLAASYDAESTPWKPADPEITKPAEADASRKLN